MTLIAVTSADIARSRTWSASSAAGPATRTPVVRAGSGRVDTARKCVRCITIARSAFLCTRSPRSELPSELRPSGSMTDSAFALRPMKGHGWASLPAGHAVAGLAIWCLTWVEQPACDYFPRCDDLGPDPAYPLQMWLCSSCGLAQLAADPQRPRSRGAPSLPRSSHRPPMPCARSPPPDCCHPVSGSPSTAARMAAPGWGCWLAVGSGRSMTAQPADVIVDCFGMMHCAGPGRPRWPSGRPGWPPGGCCCCSTTRWRTIIRAGSGTHCGTGITPTTRRPPWPPCWPRTASARGWRGSSSCTAALCCWRPAGSDACADRTRKGRWGRCSRKMPGPASAIRPCSAACSAARRPTPRDCTTGWSPSGPPGGRCWDTAPPHERSRCLRRAGVDRTLLPAVADASPAKQGLRMPGTDIPVVSPAQLAARRPDAVLLFLTDLLAEVRAAYPEIEAAGGRVGGRRNASSVTRPGWRRGSAGRADPVCAAAVQEVWSSTRSLARHRPRVGPMLPIGSPSLSDISA